MLNAARIATEFASLLPADETPETTEGYEGFYHLIRMEGGCEKAQLSYIIRDHSREHFERRNKYIEELAEHINNKYGEKVCHAVVEDQYYNMLEKVEPMMHIIDIAKQAMTEAGVTPKIQPIRGGTDGAQLSFKGLPCPNIFTGAVNFHGPHEFVSIQAMEKAVQTIVNICQKSHH
jgi:tripeptide aminopeptidase